MKIGAVLIDACNLQLNFELLQSVPPRPIVTSIQCHDLPGRLSLLTESVLPALDPTDGPSQCVATAVYDGAAYYGDFYDGVWDDTTGGRPRRTRQPRVLGTEDLLACWPAGGA
jgi:hypothetical protein